MSAKTAHVIAADVRRRIADGEIAVGSAVREMNLIERYGVSRDIAREAIGLLEWTRMVDVRRGRGGGVFVRRPDTRAVTAHAAMLMQRRGVVAAQVDEARRAIGIPTARLAAATHDPNTIDALCTSVPDDPDIDVAAALELFERAVTAACGNNTLALFAAIVREPVLAAMYAPPASGSRTSIGSLLVTARDQMIDAIRAADPEAAAAAWSAHLDRCATVVADSSLWRLGDIATVSLERRADLGAPTSRRIADDIRRRIAEGSLVAGERLASMPGLAGTHGVSRPTLREAVRILEAEGLLDLTAGTRSGPVVGPPSVGAAVWLAGIVLEGQGSTFGDVWEARGSIEPGLVELAAERIGSDELSRLRQACEAMSAARGMTAELARASVDVRMGVLHAVGNPALEVVLATIERIQRESVAMFVGAAADAPWEHRMTDAVSRVYVEILDLLERRERTKAAALWHQHQRSTLSFFDANLLERVSVGVAATAASVAG